MAANPKWRRYLRLFGPDLEADIQDELSFHIDAKTREFIERGMRPEEARERAARHFGDLREVAAMCREISEEKAKKLAWSDRAAEIVYDLHHALRGLRRAPAFAVTVVLTLAAGIAGASSLFSLVDAWILRAVRFPEPGQLVYMRSLSTRQGREIAVSMPDYKDIEARATTAVETKAAPPLSSLAAWSYETFTLGGVSSGATAAAAAAAPEQIEGIRISPNFFATLGVQPALGRAFLPQEGEFGRHRVAIVSHGFWKARLHSDPSALGLQMQLDGEPYTVIGVAPERFHFTLTGRANVWTPLALPPAELSSRQQRFLQLVGRMRPGVTVDQARQELSSIARDLAAKYPDTNREVGAFCITLGQEIGRHTGEQVVWVVFGVAMGLLLIACSNVANLLLVRAQARQRQASIQVSLGAGRGRLMRQALIETLLLFGAAACIGAVTGGVLIVAVTEMIPFENRGYLPDYGSASMNPTVFAVTLAVALLTGIVFGLGPAFESTRVNVLTVLKEAGSAVSQTGGAKRLRLALVVSQIALATILLSTTVVLVNGFRSIWNAPRGFDSNGVLSFKVSLNEKRYPDATRRRIFFETALESIPSQPGEAAAAVARFAPFSNETGATAFRLLQSSGAEEAGSQRLPTAGFNAVTPSFFSVLRTPLLKGRAFSASDTESAPLVAVVNDAFVARHIRGENPIGQKVQLARLRSREAEIVGVVAEIREGGESLRDKGVAQLYVPFAQAATSDGYVLLRRPAGQQGAVAAADTMAVLPEIRRRVAAIDPQQPVYDVKALDDRLRERFAPYQIVSGMLVWFGVLALILAAVGVYGVVAYSTLQRAREIGIRAALGAGRARLLRLFLRQGIVMLQVGMIPGLLGGFAAAMGLRSLLTDVAETSIAGPLGAAAAILGFAVLLATLVPAWRASSVDPQLAIRSDG